VEVTARPVTSRNLQAHNVRIHAQGDVATIHANTTFTKADGRAATGRYTDAWAKRDGRWVAIATHVTWN
jgi:ketosteroid isomerase-like protein